MRVLFQCIRVLKFLSLLSAIVTFVLLFQLILGPSSSDGGGGSLSGANGKASVDEQRSIRELGRLPENLYERYWELIEFYSGNNGSTGGSNVLLRQKNAFSRSKKSLFDYSLWRPGLGKDEKRRDRIVEQLVWFMEPENRKKIQHSKPKTILLLNYLSNWNLIDGNRLQCPGGEHNCRFLENKNRHSFSPTLFAGQPKIDAVILSNWQHDFIKHLPNSALKISYFLESPYSPSVRTSQNNTALLASFWTGSDIVAPYYKWVYYNASVTRRKQDFNYANGKTRKVAIFISNCLSYNDRLAYAKELSKYIQVDIYGQCGPFKCPRRDESSCFEMLKKDYKFYLAFENANCDDYITEKFFHNALNHNVVPIVLGAQLSDYQALAPEGSFIHTNSFESPKELALYLIYLDNTDMLYNEYFEWKGTGEFINTHFLCRVCAMLNYADMDHPPPNKPTSGFPWTFRNTELCLGSHKWYWNKNKVNLKENWDSSVFVSDRLSSFALSKDTSQKMFPVYNKKG